MLRTAHPQSTCAARYASYTEKNWLPPHSVARYISPSMENSSAVPAPACQANQAHCRRFRIFKRRKRHNRQRRRQNNPDDPMKHHRVMPFQKPRDLFCQKHHRHACAQYRRNNRRQVHCSDVFHKRRIEPERHQKRRKKLIPGAMMLSATQKAAEQISQKPLRNRNADPAQETQKDQHRKKRPRQRIQIPPAPSFFLLPPETSTAAFRRSARQTGTPTKLHSVSGKIRSHAQRAKNPPAAPQEHRKQKSAVL